MAKHAAFADDSDDDFDDPLGESEDDDFDDDDDEDEDGDEPEDDELELEDYAPARLDERTVMARCADELRGMLDTTLLTPRERVEMRKALTWFEREAQRG
jgi:hypothetical protein